MAALAVHYRISHWLIPSIWPETFCYTAHECLATGLPVLAFDLGAQAEAMRNAPNGHVLPWAPDRSDATDLAALVLAAVIGCAPPRQPLLGPTEAPARMPQAAPEGRAADAERLVAP